MIRHFTSRRGGHRNDGLLPQRPDLKYAVALQLDANAVLWVGAPWSRKQHNARSAGRKGMTNLQRTLQNLHEPEAGF
jgi:hypothetical protein